MSDYELLFLLVTAAGGSLVVAALCTARKHGLRAVIGVYALQLLVLYLAWCGVYYLDDLALERLALENPRARSLVIIPHFRSLLVMLAGAAIEIVATFFLFIVLIRNRARRGAA